MTTTDTRHSSAFTRDARTLLSKVPEVTLAFWIIKVLSTTVGETAADYLNITQGWGLTYTTLFMGALLIVALAVQFKTKAYTPVVYWTTVVLISIVGTLITDNMTDGYNVPLLDSTIGFGLALAATFALWYRSERTLSIHSIYTTRREAFYWLAILFTFSLGTAAGDGLSEGLALGYLTALLLFGAAIALVCIAYWGFKIDGVLAFWMAYVLTRPLGASLGDLLTAARPEGGMGISTTIISVVFLTVIVALIVYMSVQVRRRRAGYSLADAQRERDVEVTEHHAEAQAHRH